MDIWIDFFYIWVLETIENSKFITDQNIRQISKRWRELYGTLNSYYIKMGKKDFSFKFSTFNPWWKELSHDFCIPMPIAHTPLTTSNKFTVDEFHPLPYGLRSYSLPTTDLSEYLLLVWQAVWFLKSKWNCQILWIHPLTVGQDYSNKEVKKWKLSKIVF